MSLVTGNQLKAARALAGVDQRQVADAAKINVNTIRNMEARGVEPITSSAVTVRNVQMALEAWGIEFLDHGQPGVRLREPGAVPAVALARAAKPSAGVKTATRGKARKRRS
jgi:transcriptional regulator with XRE-family HTH domain